MKLARILTITLLTVSLFIGLATAQSNWPKGAPTPGQIEKFFSQIESGRITKENLRKFLDGNEPASYQSARRILGNDFLPPEEVTTARYLSYTKDQLNHFTKTLPPKNILLWAKDNGYAVIAGPPASLNLLGTRSLKPELFWSSGKGWYENENFAKNDKVTTNWLIIRKEPVPNSTRKNWDEQLQLLAKDEQVPNAGEMSWFITTFYEVRRVRLFEQVNVRTSSVTLRDLHVYISFFGESGLIFDYDWNDVRNHYIGLAASRKF